jgi:DNA-binding NtrC family response regulator
VILCQNGEIQPHHLPESIRADAPAVRESAPAPDLVAAETNGGSRREVRLAAGTPLADAERALIHETLTLCEGNKTKTAAMLGISVKTLYTKLRLYAEAETVAPSSP